jgi:tRNA-splicing ligase RtcB
MIEIRGRYNTAKVFTDNIDDQSYEQIMELCSQEFTVGSRIRIMPDAHAGAGCTIGTTMTIEDKVVPNLVGVDIGCGMETILLEETEIDLEKLDRIIHRHIPAGFDIRNRQHPYVGKVELEKLACRKHVDMHRALLSVGTLGGGNHFIEVGRSDSGNVFLVVHSGSRHLGKQAAEYYQDRAYRELKEAGRAAGISKSLAYLHGDSFREYLDDMKIVQKYAVFNRKAIVDEILAHTEAERQGTVHHDPQLHRPGPNDPEKGRHFGTKGRKGADSGQYARRQPDLHRERE